MFERIVLDRFTKNDVSIITEKVNEVGFVVEVHRVSYENSVIGRELVERNVPELYKSIIFMMWGDSPTVNEEI